jgi:hypothetical protein
MGLAPLISANDISRAPPSARLALAHTFNGFMCDTPGPADGVGFQLAAVHHFVNSGRRASENHARFLHAQITVMDDMTDWVLQHVSTFSMSGANPLFTYINRYHGKF